MKFEHLALMMEDPIAAAKWYCDNLEFKIVKRTTSVPFAYFIVDASKQVMLEIFRFPDKEVPDYKSIDPSIMHLGFNINEIEAKYDKLVSAGATIINEISVSENGDVVTMLRDPWGLPIQLINRKEQLIP